MRIVIKKQYPFIEKRRAAYVVSGAAIVVSLLAMIWNLVSMGSWVNYGVDFTGGTLIQVQFTQPVTPGDVRNALGGAGAPAVTQFGTENEFVVRAPLAEGIEVAEVRAQIEEQLAAAFGQSAFTVVRTELVGPTIGEELQRKAALAIMISFALTLIYLAVRFELRFGLAAVIATMHDLAITLGIIALFRLEVQLPTIAAILTIVGYSINDKVVIFDRIRENLNARGGRKQDQVALIDRSINETIPRTIMTGLSVLTSLLSLLFLGPVALRDFSLVLFLGIVIGTYSSVFIASPALIEIQKRMGSGSERARTKARQAEHAAV
jgi:preprotein translocase subunit SecF